jgi:acyl-coenzyme A synthetase/AMP-(fatty) acid ligase
MRSKENFSNILYNQALLFPDKIYCKKINGRGVTFLELETYVNNCCFFLEEQGLKFGDILTINIPNSISSIVLYLSAIRSGLKINPSPSTLSERELVKHAKYIKTKTIISSQHLSFDLLHPGCSTIHFTNDDSFLDKISSYSSDSFNREIDANEVACIYYSSGTTGNSKYVMYSHLNMVSLSESIVSDFGFSSDTKHLGILPLGHTAITNYQFLPSLYSGSTIYLAENFNLVRSNIWKIINYYKIDYLQLVPTLIFAMLSVPYKEADYTSNISLKYIGCGSAPLSVETQIKFYEKFNVKVANLYGLSETGPSHFDDPMQPNWQPGSIGTPLSVNECKVFDKNMVELGPDEVGQIALRGDNIFIGYYNNKTAYKESFFKDYFLTGDIGFRDDKGRFYFSDREKDLIIRGGVNIVPGEIEEVIFKLPGVHSAAVVGMADDYFGEAIVAFVQKKDYCLSDSDVMDILIKNLQPLKIPSKIIFIDEMPVGPSGKILKRKLREELSNA